MAQWRKVDIWERQSAALKPQRGVIKQHRATPYVKTSDIRNKSPEAGVSRGVEALIIRIGNSNSEKHALS